MLRCAVAFTLSRGGTIIRVHLHQQALQLQPISAPCNVYGSHLFDIMTYFLQLQRDTCWLAGYGRANGTEIDSDLFRWLLRASYVMMPNDHQNRNEGVCNLLTCKTVYIHKQEAQLLLRWQRVTSNQVTAMGRSQPQTIIMLFEIAIILRRFWRVAWLSQCYRLCHDFISSLEK